MRPFNPSKIPPEVLHLIFQNLTDHKDKYACALVNRAFNAIVTPLLYRELKPRSTRDSISSPDTNRLQSLPPRVYHPALTLLSRPELAKYVRHITEDESLLRDPKLLAQARRAIALCTHLTSFEWIDMGLESPIVTIPFIEAIRVLPVKELVICTTWELDDRAWQLLPDLQGLRNLTLLCEAPRVLVLREWAGNLGDTLTQLTLSCLDVDTTVLAAVFSRLPLLLHLQLENAPVATIPTLLTHLPNLCSFQADYLGDDWDYRKPDRPLPVLKRLVVDGEVGGVDDYNRFWDWMLGLVAWPNSLEILGVSLSQGWYKIDRTPIMKLLDLHGKLLRSLQLDALLELEDLVFVCDMFPELEELEFAMVNQDLGPVMIATSSAKKLRALRVKLCTPELGFLGILQQFTIHDAREVMTRSQSLRAIGINLVDFAGKWVMKDGQLEFVVEQSDHELILDP